MCLNSCWIEFIIRNYYSCLNSYWIEQNITKVGEEEEGTPARKRARVASYGKDDDDDDDGDNDGGVGEKSKS